MRLRLSATLAASAALAVGASACGGEDEQPTAATPPQQQEQAATPQPVAEIASLSGRSTAVKLDAGFVEALSSLKVTPGAVGDARITEGGSAVFPITGGNVTYYKPGSVSPYVQGTIRHQNSGLSLRAGGTTVKLTDFVVDPGRSVLTGTVSVDGKVAAQSAPLFFLDGRTLNPLQVRQNNTAVLEGTTVKLKAEAAELLNQTFAIQDLQEGLVIGIAKITINTK